MQPQVSDDDPEIVFDEAEVSLLDYAKDKLNFTNNSHLPKGHAMKIIHYLSRCKLDDAFKHCKVLKSTLPKIVDILNVQPIVEQAVVDQNSLKIMKLTMPEEKNLLPWKMKKDKCGAVNAILNTLVGNCYGAEDVYLQLIVFMFNNRENLEKSWKKCDWGGNWKRDFKTEVNDAMNGKFRDKTFARYA